VLGGTLKQFDDFFGSIVAVKPGAVARINPKNYQYAHDLRIRIVECRQ